MRAILSIAVLAWLLAIVLTLRAVAAYDHKPGLVGTIQSQWPGASKLMLAKKGHTLVLSLHPNCSCSRATVEELAQTLSDSPSDLAVYVLAVRPEGLPNDPTHTALIEKVRALPGVTLVWDNNGKESALFGAKTSGHTSVFDSTGQLLFTGGITESRGHAGANPGQRAVALSLHDQIPALKQTPVYGCSLLSEGNSR